MRLVDSAPFIVVLLVGVVAGRLLAGWLAWLLALLLPVAHFAVSIGTGRGKEGLLAYVVPVSIILVATAVVGLGAGRWLRGRESKR